jgi:hypothetical protein
MFGLFLAALLHFLGYPAPCLGPPLIWSRLGCRLTVLQWTHRGETNRGEISGGNPLVSILKPPKAVASGFPAGDSPFPGASKPISFEVTSPCLVSPRGTGDTLALPISDPPFGGSSLTHVSGMGGGELLFTPLFPSVSLCEPRFPWDSGSPPFSCPASTRLCAGCPRWRPSVPSSGSSSLQDCVLCPLSSLVLSASPFSVHRLWIFHRILSIISPIFVSKTKHGDKLIIDICYNGLGMNQEYSVYLSDRCTSLSKENILVYLLRIQIYKR